jgi:outer membrane biogenesis lipoprotein LolB
MMPKRILVLLLAGMILPGCATTERRKERIQAAQPQWDQATVEKIAAWRIEPGMTREMVQAGLL